MNQIEGSDSIINIDEKSKDQVNFVPIGIFMTNKDGDCVFVNKKWCEITGLSPDEALGQGWVKRIHPDDIEQVFSKWNDFAESGKQFQMEFRFQAPIGKTTWVRGEASKIRSNPGKNISYLGTIIEITSEKEAEKELVDSNFLLKTIFDTTDTLLAYLDTQFNFLMVNEAYSRVDNKEPSFFVGKNYFDLYPDEENKEIFESVVKTGEPFFVIAKPIEYPNNPEYGIRFWDWSLQPINDESNKVKGLVFSLKEVTQRKESQKARSFESEERFRRIYEEAPIGIMLTDLNYSQFMINDAFCRMIGYREEELKKMTFLELSHPKDNVRNKKLAEKLKNGNISELTIENQFIKKNKEHFWARTHVALIRDEKNSPAHFLIMVEDIDEHKRIEMESQRQLLRFEINDGEMYLIVESTPIAASRAVNDLLSIAYNGVIFSRKSKVMLGEIFHGDFEYHWMNQISEEDPISFKQNIIKIVKEKESRTVILFDRLDFIISTVGFNETLSLIYKLKDYAYLNNLVILFSIDQMTIDQKEKALLLKEMNPLLPRRLIELSNESLEILRVIFTYNNSGYQPSQTELCIKLNLSRPTARKRVKKLVSTGFLTETRRGNRKALELSERGRLLFI